MIDLHCHILPGLDDGADSWETALEMGRMAAEAGTVTVAATCHYLHPSSRLTSFGTDFEWAYREKRERLQAFFEKMKINLTLASGAEIFAGEDFLTRMGREPLPTLNGTRCLLVETPPDAPAFSSTGCWIVCWRWTIFPCWPIRNGISVRSGCQPIYMNGTGWGQCCR